MSSCFCVEYTIVFLRSLLAKGAAVETVQISGKATDH